MSLAWPHLPGVAISAPIDSQIDSKTITHDHCNLRSGNDGIMALCSDSVNKKILAHESHRHFRKRVVSARWASPAMCGYLRSD